MPRVMRRCAIALLLLLQTACLGAVPADEYSYVIHFGVEEGDVLPYRFAFVVNSETESASSGESKPTVLLAEARNLYEAIDTLAGSMSNQLNFSRTTLIVFSRPLAEKDCIPDVLNIVYGKLKIRENTRIMITESDMKAMLEGMAAVIDPSLGKVRTSVTRYAETTGMIVDTTLGQMTEAFRQKTHDAMVCYAGVNTGVPIQDMAGCNSYPYLGGSMLSEGQLKTSIAGTAVFSGTRMTGVLDGQHTLLLLLCSGNFSLGRILMPYADTELTLSISRIKAPRVTFVDADDIAVYTSVEVSLERPRELANIPADELEEIIARWLSNETAHVFLAVQNAGSDVFGFGKTAVRRFSDMSSWRLYDWDSAYRRLSVSFLYSVKLSHDPGDVARE